MIDAVKGSLQPSRREPLGPIISQGVTETVYSGKMSEQIELAWPEIAEELQKIHNQTVMDLAIQRLTNKKLEERLQKYEPSGTEGAPSATLAAPSRSERGTDETS